MGKKYNGILVLRGSVCLPYIDVIIGHTQDTNWEQMCLPPASTLSSDTSSTRGWDTHVFVAGTPFMVGKSGLFLCNEEFPFN